MKEVWKDVKGYEGVYQVSNYGRVRKITILKQCNKKGYRKISLHKQGTIKTFAVHRLVAEAFIPNPDNKLEVNHINAIKDDNNVNNLEWVTREENMKHAVNKGLLKPDTNHNGLAIPVLMDDEIVFDSIRKCAEYVGVDKSEIRKALKGKYKTVHGHTFRKLNE